MENLMPNHQRAQNVRLVFWIMLAVTVLSFVSEWMQYNLVSQESVDEAAAQLNDNRQLLVGLLQSASFIFAVVFFIMWFRRAYNNLHLIGVPNLSFSEGWAAGSWFVPILNLFRPYHIMKEIWHETQANIPGRQQIEGSSVVGWWWAMYIIGNIIENITVRATMSADTLEGLAAASQAAMISHIASIPGILLVLAMVKRTSAFEAELFQAYHEVNIDDHLVVGFSSPEF